MAGRMRGSLNKKKQSTEIGRELVITACGKTADALVALWQRLDRAQRRSAMIAISRSMARLGRAGAGAAGGRAISIRRRRICAGAAAGGND